MTLARAPAGDDPAFATAGTLTIDLGALAANWRLLRDRAAPGECAAVVKADAYGIGLEQAGGALWAAGCRTFFVAHLSEGIRLRARLPDATIYVLNGYPTGTAGCFADHDLRPILGSPDEIADWATAGRTTGLPPVAVHVDTGMNRLGLAPEEFVRLVDGPDLAACRPALLMSHLVAAEDPDDPVTARQVAAFAALRRAAPSLPGSLANSSGLFVDGTRHDLARPGYALYGGNPTPGAANPMRPVVRLTAPIVQVRTVAAGERAGYNGRWTAAVPSRLATIPIGYADGYLRVAGETDSGRERAIPSGEAVVAGRRCPIVGRISMDLAILDVTGLDPADTRRGAPVTLIGDGLDVDEVGRRAGTIGYEILTGLGRRYRRCYDVGDEDKQTRTRNP